MAHPSRRLISVPEHRQSADGDQWKKLVTEVYDLTRDLEELAHYARERSAAESPQGLPRSSPGFGERGRLTNDPDDGGGSPHSDPTGETASQLADGIENIGVHRRRMELQTTLARDSLRRAVADARACKPERIADPVREECVDCKTSKWVITERGTKPKRWVVAESRCSSCARRRARYAS